MAERTLADPLADFEIIPIALAKMEMGMKRDCTLMGGQAYSGFVLDYEIKIRYLRSQTPPTLIWGHLEQKPEGEVESAGEETVKGTYTSGPPDIERRDNHLPVPVIVQTPTGPVRRRVHVERAKQ